MKRVTPIVFMIAGTVLVIFAHPVLGGWICILTLLITDFSK